GGTDRVFPDRGMPLRQGGSTFRGGLLDCGPPFDAWRRSTCDEGPHQGMNGAPTDISLVAEPGHGRDAALPRHAQIYFIAVAMAAWFVGRWLILEHAGIANDALRLSMAGLAACIVFVAVNHVLLAVMLRLARGFTLRETGLFDAEYLATDLVLAALGVAVYAFWQTSPWLVPCALTPLFLIHRSLRVPALQAEGR